MTQLAWCFNEKAVSDLWNIAWRRLRAQCLISEPILWIVKTYCSVKKIKETSILIISFWEKSIFLNIFFVLFQINLNCLGMCFYIVSCVKQYFRSAVLVTSLNKSDDYDFLWWLSIYPNEQTGYNEIMNHKFKFKLKVKTNCSIKQ